MNLSRLRTQLALAGAVVFASVALAAAVAMANPATSWDQARVTGIAHDLVKSVDELYHNEYRAPGETYLAPLGTSDAHQEFMDTLRRLQNEARHLATSLEKGAGAKATKGSVKQIAQLSRDLEEYGRMMEFVSPVLEQFAQFKTLIGRLAPYYGLGEKG